MDSLATSIGICVPRVAQTETLVLEGSPMKHTVIGVDLAKDVFEIAVSHEPGKVADRHRVRRAGFLSFFAQRKPTTIELPVPFGPKARLVQIHLDTEAIRTQCPEIEVEDSMTAFASSILGYEPNGRELRALKTQLGSLSAATIRIANTGDKPFQIQTHIVSAFDIWFPKDANQRVLWPSVIKLSSDYYQTLIDHAVPLDPRAVAALSHSAMGLSIYSWLAQRLCRVNHKRSSFVAWANLWEQFGPNYKKIFKFRQVFNVALKQVLSQYPHAEVTVNAHRGLTLHHSRPPIERVALVRQ